MGIFAFNVVFVTTGEVEVGEKVDCWGGSIFKNHLCNFISF